MIIKCLIFCKNRIKTRHLEDSLKKDTQTLLIQVMSRFGQLSFSKENSVIISITTDRSNKLLIARYMTRPTTPKGDNISEAARQLFIHRNTLVYRVDKIKKNTGFDLREFEDAMMFRVVMMMKKYIEYMEDVEK